MATEPENLKLHTFKALPRELAEHRTLLLAVVDQGRRTERRLGEPRDELELTVKIELMGRQASFETIMKERLL